MSDLRYAVRMLLKNPGFTIVAVLTLALGIRGEHHNVYRPSGVNDSPAAPIPSISGRLIQIFQTTPNSQRDPHSVANFLDLQIQSRDFVSLAALNSASFSLSEAAQPAERVQGVLASSELFPLLGIQPELGRAFTAAEDRPGRDNVVILDHGFWLRRFAGDTNIIGRALRLDGGPVIVVGVMPERFRDLMLAGPVSLWRPIAFTDEQSRNRGVHYLKVIARLKPGVSRSQAEAGIELIATRLAQDYPDNNSRQSFRLEPLAEASLPPEGRRVVWMTMMLACFVLLIACANLANLQFARTAMRKRELAIRGALGAPRGRVLRQLLTESLMIACLGGLLGLEVAWWGNQILKRQIVVEGENVLMLALNLRVLGFALAASAISGLAFGLLPALLASRSEVNEALKQGSRGTAGDRSQHRMQDALVVAQVTLALVLLSGAGLVIRGLQRYSKSDPGWRVDGLSLGYLSLPKAKYGDDQSPAFAARLQEHLAALPGVERVAVAWTLPVRQFNVSASFSIAGRPDARPGQEPERYVNGVTPGYFRTLGMRLLEGRDFTAADTANKPGVIIINETMARAFWPGESPLGKRIDNDEVVGVVNAVRFPANPFEVKTHFQTYRPLAQAPGSSLAVALRGNVTAETLRRAVAELDPDLPVGEAGPALADVGRSFDDLAVGGKIFGGFALLGLLLAGLGIYGVIAGFVVRRTNEIGVRMALGAQISAVLWLVIGKGLRLSLLGAAIGLVGVLGLARLLASIVPDLPAADPFIILFVAALLLAVAFFACWLPARRAACVDPLVALRSE